jgi:hypothetical protein
MVTHDPEDIAATDLRLDLGPLTPTPLVMIDRERSKRRPVVGE